MYLFGNQIKNNILLRNILVLFTGAGFAHVIPALSSLVLSRLYNQVNYGELSVFISITSILAITITLSYDTIIVMSKRTNEARHFLILSIVLSCVISSIYTLLFLIFHLKLENFLDLRNSVLFLLPIAILLTGLYTALTYWFNRKGLYKIIVKGQLLQASMMALIRVLLGCGEVADGLIYGFVIGEFIALFYYCYLYYKFEKRRTLCIIISMQKLKKVIKENANYSLLFTAGNILNSLSNIGLPIIITIFYSAEVAGVYFFSYNIIRLPIGLLSKSISQVYKREASLMYNKHLFMDLYLLTRKIQTIIFLFVLPIILIFSLYGASLFSVIFGQSWKESGSIIKYFAVFVLFNSLYSPISSIAEILRKQVFMLFFNMSLAFFPIIVFAIGAGLRFHYALLISSIISAMHFAYIDMYMKRQLRKNIIHEKMYM